MAKGVRDMDIGIPSDLTLRDIHNKLEVVKDSIDILLPATEESNFHLGRIATGTGLITDIDIEEVDE